MGIKRLKPTSPARRYQTYLTRDELTPNAKPEKSLLSRKREFPVATAMDELQFDGAAAVINVITA
jgi:hypothetical protein